MPPAAGVFVCSGLRVEVFNRSATRLSRRRHGVTVQAHRTTLGSAFGRALVHFETGHGYVVAGHLASRFG
jgi:hypothetical protein